MHTSCTPAERTNRKIMQCVTAESTQECQAQQLAGNALRGCYAATSWKYVYARHLRVPERPSQVLQLYHCEDKQQHDCKQFAQRRHWVRNPRPPGCTPMTQLQLASCHIGLICIAVCDADLNMRDFIELKPCALAVRHKAGSSETASGSACDLYKAC